jgi:threonine aldolase
MDKLDACNTVCRFCTSWATRKENVDALCADLEKVSEI